MRDLRNRILFAIITIFAVGIIVYGGDIVKAQERTWLWPTDGEITDVFGTRSGHHNGVDISAPIGTPVVSMKPGVVSKSYYSESYGNVIFILHNNGFESVYAHMSKRMMEKGEKVNRGQVIGEVGNTGRSTGSHLHFEVHKGRWNIEKSNAINPVALLEGPELMAKKNDSVETAAKQTASQHIESNHPNADEKKSKPGHKEEKKQMNSSKQNGTENRTDRKEVVVTVEKGDTLWGIGQKHEIPVKLIKKWNDLDSSMLTIGKKLTLYPNAIETYVVEKGDTLPEISNKTGISVPKLLQFNQLEKQPIYPSQVLVLNE